MTRHLHPDDYAPFPEIVEPEAHPDPYRIVDSRDNPWLPSNGMTSKTDRAIFVPLHPTGRPISLHELAHVKWSPTRLPRVRHDPRVLMAVEDARINLGLARIDLPLVLSPGERGRASTFSAGDLERDDRATFILRCIAALGTNVVDEIVGPAGYSDLWLAELTARLRDRVRERLDAGAVRRRAPVTSFKHARRIARDLARELAALGLIDPSTELREAACGCLRAGLVVGDGTGPADAGRTGGARPLRGRMVAEGRSGTMHLREAPLTVEVPRVAAGRRRTWRPATEGAVVRFTHRAAIDGAIFRHRGRRHGGTVLIDVSGSMSLTSDGIRRIVRETAGAATVAIYSGKHDEGELRIVARGGRMAGPDDLRPFGGGNIVDLPALQWLAKQPSPRVWISDGGVSGVGDLPAARIKEACKRTCRHARIERVRTVDDAVRRLTGR